MKYCRAYARIDETADASAPITWVASTEGVKGDGLDLRADEWDLSRYEKYSPVLWVHDYWGGHPPIGTGKARIENNQLLIDVTYDSDDPFAMTIQGKARKGMMAGSVGWEVIKAEDDKPHNRLMEFSMAPMGMDPDALPLQQGRAWRDMLANLENDQRSREETWRETATEMVGLLIAPCDLPMTERRHKYNDIERRYRELGKTAPELVDAMEPDLAAGLFLEGEPALLPELFAVPEQLTRKQVGAIQQAMDILQAALDSADVEPEPDPEPEPKADESLDDLLQALSGENDNE